MDGKQLQQQYKHHISEYKDWDQREHADHWMLFERNMGIHLSIDETALSNDELYTVVTNKAAKGLKGAIVAMIKGTQADRVIDVLMKLSERSGTQVQEIRIKYRWQELDEENEQLTLAKKQQQAYIPRLLSNGDSPKQLLARCRYLLFKHPGAWTSTQKQQATLVFERYPRLKQAYDLSMKLRDIFRCCTCKEQAFKRLALWYNQVEEAAIDSFRTVSRSIQTHYIGILDYFNNRSTNASAEAFNAKIKAFRASARGVRDVVFFLFRLAKIYA